MKKAFTISIAHTLFSIEEDAYTKLDTYLTSIRNRFKDTEGSSEIINDIEARISEQFIETKKKIITLHDVNTIITSMGNVEDFDDGVTGAAHTTPSSTPRKKLYRNPSDKIIMGVCSGMAAYSGVDAVWIRILYIAFTLLTHGFGIILYIILALVIPEAKTASQKLEMEGSPVTLETMSENIKVKVEELQEKHGSKLQRLIALPFILCKKILDVLIYRLGPFFRICIGLFLSAISLGAVLFFSFAAPLLLTNSESYFDFPLATIISPFLLYVVVMGVYFSLTIPLALLFVAGIGIIRRKNYIHTTLIFTLLIMWCVAFTSSAVGLVNSAQRIEHYTSLNPLYETTSKELPVQGPVHNVEVHDGIRLTLLQGATTTLSVTGRARLINDISAVETNGTLTIHKKDSFHLCFCNLRDMDVTLTIPTLTSLQVEDGSDLTVNQWTAREPFLLEAERGSRTRLHMTGSSTDIRAQHGAHVELTGSLASTSISADFGSMVDAYNADIKESEVHANHGSTILLKTVDTLTATADNGSTVTYDEVRVLDKRTNNASEVRSTRMSEDEVDQEIE